MMFRLNRYLTDDPKPRISKTENVKVLDWLKSPVSTHQRPIAPPAPPARLDQLDPLAYIYLLGLHQ